MTKTGASLFRLFVLVSLLLSYTPAAFPQTLTTGAVQGRVHVVGSPDTGIPKATIVVTNEESGLQRSISTNDSGDYFFGILPPGRYTIAVTAEGYEGRTIPNFAVYNSKTNMVIPPIALQTATVATSQPPNPTPPKEQRTSTDSGAEQLTNTSNASRGENFDRVMLRTLPLPGIRTFDDLAFLAPGVAPPPQAIGNSVGPGVGAGVGTSGQFAVNGLRSRSNNFTIDGSDNNDEDIGVRRQGFTSLVPQSIESLQEFQITTLLPEPQFGRAMGAQVNAVTRSGSRDLHGNAYVFYTNERLRARDPFDLTGGPSKFPLTRETTFVSDHAPILLNGNPLEPANIVGEENPFGRTQYGFTLGGPFHQPDALFFVSFEHQKASGSKESNFAVPTVAQRGFFDTGETGGICFCDSQGKLQPVFPTSLAGDAFFSLFPFPNNPRGPFGRNTFTDLLRSDSEGSLFSVKLDRQNIKAFGKDHTLTGRYNFTDDDTILPVTGEALFSSLRPLVRTQNLSVIFNSAISARTSNQGRFSWGRTSLDFTEVRNAFLKPSLLPNAPPFLLNATVLFNNTRPIIQNGLITGFNPTSYGTASFSDGSIVTTEDIIGPIGQVIISGFSPVGVDVFNFPQQRTNNTYQYADTIIFNLGKQRLTAGVDIRNVKLKSMLERNSRPLAVFTDGLAKRKSGFGMRGDFAGLTRGNSLAAVGAPTGLFQSITSESDPTITLRDWQSNLFFADQFHIRSNFTLTFGLRYENNTVPTEDQRRIEDTFGSQEVLTFEKLERDLTGISGLEHLLGGRTKIFRRDNNNVGPNVAFAWDIFGDGKSAVRAGYGVYYDQIPGAVINQSRNVFPTFLTTNTAGFQASSTGILLPVNLAGGFLSFSDGPNGPFVPVTVPGTLNRLNVDFVQRILGGDVTQLGLLLSLFTGQSIGAGGLAFVLPSANLETPFAQHWGITVEQQIKKDYLVSLGYVGTRGTHLLRFATPNLGPNGIPVIRNFISDASFIPLAVGTVSPPRGGRPFPLLGSVTTIESDANSIYHALQFQVIKRFSHGFQLTTAYTWSHAIDEVSDIFDLAGAPTLPQNSFDRRAERGDANFDVRHRFVSSFIWELPIFEQNKYLGGWELAGIGTFSSGQPYTILAGLDVNQDGNLTDRLSDTSSITQVHDGASRFTFNGNLNQFVTGQDGAVGRNTFRAQGTSLVNLALNKHFRFNERHDVEFRSEFFNVFNRTHFGIPINQFGFPGFGNSVNTRVPNRTVQLALKYSF